jgi:hypothetical protein
MPPKLNLSARTADAFRATGITAYLKNGGKLEIAQQMAAHESTRTTGLYDRRSDEISLDEVERIGVEKVLCVGMLSEVLEQDKQVQWIGGRRSEVKLLVVPLCSIILCMDSQSPNASNIGGLQSAQDSITQESAANSLPLPVFVNREAGQQHDWNRMPRQSLLEAFRGIQVFDLAYNEAVIPNDGTVYKPEIGLSCI